MAGNLARLSFFNRKTPFKPKMSIYYAFYALFWQYLLIDVLL